MKKLLLFLSLLLLVSVLVIACGDSGTTEDDATEAPATEKAPDPVSSGTETEATPSDTEAPATEETETQAEGFNFDPDDYTFVQKFPAPEGDRREEVMNYVSDMMNVEWKPAENFTITWKEKGDFEVNLEYKKGQTCLGVPYGQTKCDLELFEQFVNDGVFKDKSYYYEEIVGNHCSSMMFIAYQRLVDVPYGTLKPSTPRLEWFSFPLDENGNELLKRPDFATYGDGWITKDLFDCNTKDEVFKAYAALGHGDALLKAIHGSGHSRLVDSVELKKNMNGSINYSQSSVVCIEQTNQFDKDRPDAHSTWYLDHKYAFSKLYNDLFMPITLVAYNTDAPLDDAYILFKSTDTNENILQGSDGKITSNFPLNYVRITLKNASGELVKDALDYNFSSVFEYDLKSLSGGFFSGVPAGKYTFTIRAGIARGGCDVESFEVEVK